MNKQAITFLSLFSLILVLSVYYILLPPIEVTPASSPVSQAGMGQIEVLQANLDQERMSLISDNNEIIATSSSSSDDIKVALETIAKTKEITNLEKEYVTLLQDAGFKEVFVEIHEFTIKVVVQQKEPSASDANKIIKLILEKSGMEYQVEVKFVTN